MRVTSSQVLFIFVCFYHYIYLTVPRVVPILELVGDTGWLLSHDVRRLFPNSRLVLSGMLRCRGVNWRRVGAMNDRLEWVVRNLGATFVDPNGCIQDGDFSRDGLHMNRSGARQLGDLYSRVCKIDGESQKGLNN